YSSPAILLRSGIGPPDQLAALGISVALDLPGVGANLLDHPFVRSRVLTPWTIRTGAWEPRTSFNQVLVKGRSGQRSDEIDLHIYEGQRFDSERDAWVFWLSVSLQDAHSRGCVRLTSADPSATLDIDHRWLAEPDDLSTMCDGIELALELVGQRPL